MFIKGTFSWSGEKKKCATISFSIGTGAYKHDDEVVFIKRDGEWVEKMMTVARWELLGRPKTSADLGAPAVAATDPPPLPDDDTAMRLLVGKKAVSFAPGKKPTAPKSALSAKQR
eukprot:gene22193-38557_t